MSNANEIEGSVENWEIGKLGQDAKYVVPAIPEEEQSLEVALSDNDGPAT